MNRLYNCATKGYRWNLDRWVDTRIDEVINNCTDNKGIHGNWKHVTQGKTRVLGEVLLLIEKGKSCATSYPAAII